MPTGNVSARGAWYPSWWRRIVQPSGRNYVTRRLVRELPWGIARVIRHLDRMELDAPEVTEGSVLITIGQTHADSVNAKDLWLRLEINCRLTSRRVALRNAVEREVNKVLTDICSAKTGRPTVDINIVFVDSTGCTIGPDGEHLDDW